MEKQIRVFIAAPSGEYIELLTDALSADTTFLVVGTAVSGTDAYARISDCHPDLLLTDLLLPGLDGLGLLRQLKADGNLPHVIVVSGFYNDRMARILSALADNYLPKPCQTRELLHLMRESVLDNGCTLVRDYDSAVTRALIDCGIMPHLNGFSYLRTAILSALNDPGQLHGITKSLYRDIARHYSTTPACVERSIRSAIERAWEHRSAQDRRSYFGSLFDLYPKAPSNLPFLTSMTEYVESLFEQNAAEL